MDSNANLPAIPEENFTRERERTVDSNSESISSDAHTKVLTIILQLHACHCTAKCVTKHVLKTYTVTQAQ